MIFLMKKWRILDILELYYDLFNCGNDFYFDIFGLKFVIG